MGIATGFHVGIRGDAGLGHSAEPRNRPGDPGGETFACHGRRASGCLKAGALRAVKRITFERWGWELARRSFATPGSEAVEAAWLHCSTVVERCDLIPGGFHGLGLGALEVIGISAFREPFQSQLGRLRFSYPIQIAFDVLLGGVRISA